MKAALNVMTIATMVISSTLAIDPRASVATNFTGSDPIPIDFIPIDANPIDKFSEYL
jgi:hypothetical protein